MGEPEDTIVSDKNTVTTKLQNTRFHLCEGPREVTYTETESRIVLLSVGGKATKTLFIFLAVSLAFND